MNDLSSDAYYLKMLIILLWPSWQHWQATCWSLWTSNLYRSESFKVSVDAGRRLARLTAAENEPCSLGKHGWQNPGASGSLTPGTWLCILQCRLGVSRRYSRKNRFLTHKNELSRGDFDHQFFREQICTSWLVFYINDYSALKDSGAFRLGGWRHQMYIQAAEFQHLYNSYCKLYCDLQACSQPSSQRQWSQALNSLNTFFSHSFQ